MASDDGRPSRWRWLSADYEYLSRLQLTGTSSLISAWPASALNVKRWIYSGGFYPDYRKQRCQTLGLRARSGPEFGFQIMAFYRFGRGLAYVEFKT